MKLQFSLIHHKADIQNVAKLMSASEPWITLKRNFEDAITLVNCSDNEIYIASADKKFIGFAIVKMKGAFIGYIQSVAIVPEYRNQGIGKTFFSFLEKRIFSEQPNVFICASSFNPKAQRLYEKLGYTVIGELKDYIVEGHSEILMRKTISPLSSY